MIKLFTSPLLRKAAFAVAALLVAGTAAVPAQAGGYYRPAGYHSYGWHGGYHAHWYGRYWGPRYYGPAYVYPPAAYVPAPGVSVWIR